MLGVGYNAPTAENHFPRCLTDKYSPLTRLSLTITADKIFFNTLTNQAYIPLLNSIVIPDSIYITLMHFCIYSFFSYSELQAP